MTAKVIQVIETQVLRGKGIESDPMRHVTEYWSFDGAKLAENDPTLELELTALRALAANEKTA